MPLTLGTIGHICIAVSNPKRSAQFWTKKLNLRKEFEFPGGVLVGNDAVAIALLRGKPSPKTIDHISFHVRGKAALRAALAELKRKKVDLEDPGDEIGPEAPGSPNLGLWFHDPDGYRWELSALAPAPRKKRK
jgi:catechol 2,3-dioxygenase-like lactoylglutathione lyase family enzyme